MWGRVRERTMPLAQLSAGFQSLSLLPTSKLGPSGADSQVGGFVYIPEPCESLQRTLLWGWEFLPPPQPPRVFSVRGFEALFPCTGTLGCVVYLAPQFILPIYPHVKVGPLGPLAAALLWVLSTQLPISAPPTSLDECFFFNSLVVGLPYSSIFWQFCLVFVFKCVVLLLLVVQGGTVCLPTPPSCLEVSKLIFHKRSLLTWSLLNWDRVRARNKNKRTPGKVQWNSSGFLMMLSTWHGIFKGKLIPDTESP